MKERTKLLPKWIYFLSWPFLLFLGTPIVMFISLHIGYASYSMYGIRFSGNVFHPISIALLLLGTYKGIVAYGLLWGKRWGVKAGIIFALIAIACSLISTIYWFSKGDYYFDITFVFLFIFLNDLYDIRKRWVDIKDDGTSNHKD